MFTARTWQATLLGIYNSVGSGFYSKLGSSTHVRRRKIARGLSIKPFLFFPTLLNLKYMHLLRARIKKDIICEFLPSARKSARVIIFADGMPTVPSKKSLAEFWAKKNYWVFHPRYRGSWESAGIFLKSSPERDLLDLIDALHGEITSLYDGVKFKVHPREIYIYGASFGGAAALLTSCNPRVTKVIAFSPVVDWTAHSKAEPLSALERFTREAFGEGYRVSHREFQKLASGKFFNPTNHITEIDGSKVLIFHAYDDDIVSYKYVEKFARQTGAKLKLYKNGGHFSLSASAEPLFYRQIQQFFKK